ncbi:MAG: hypothetical protein ACPL7D_05720 [Candidatus Sumerlaeaceae bacterium]
MMKKSCWTSRILVLGTAFALFAGCSQQKPPQQEKSSTEKVAVTKKAKSQKEKKQTHLKPKIEEKSTTDGRAILGSLVFVPPNEVRLYPHPTFPGDKRASVRASVVVDGASTVPAVFGQIASMQYYVAFLTDEVKPPVPATLRLSADGYHEAEIKTTLAAVAPNAEKNPAGLTATNPREYTKLIQNELARLELVVERGNVAFAPQFTKQIWDAVSGLALTSNEKVEMALQPAVTALGTAVTSMTEAKKHGNAAEAKAVLNEVKKIIEHDVRPHFVAE